jgi:hypothetical protein
MIKFPNVEEMTRYAELVRRREPYVRGVIGFLDGLNQIATVFDLEYEKVINVEGYDRIHRYYAAL